MISAVGYLRLAVEAVGAAVVGLGLSRPPFCEFSPCSASGSTRTRRSGCTRDATWRRGLSFNSAPTFSDVELLAVIVAIRTILNYFLSKELERERREVAPQLERDDAVRG